MNKLTVAVVAVIGFTIAYAKMPIIGAAPKGDVKKVASRVIKYNFPECKHVKNAMRNEDGSIRATCDGVRYMVFTLFDSAEGRVLEVAMNCVAAKKHLNYSC